MSTEYTTNIFYEDLIKTKSVEIKNPKNIFFIVPHKLIIKDNICLFIIKENNELATIIRYGLNDVSKIFPHLLKEFPNLIIFDPDYGEPWKLIDPSNLLG